MCRRNLHLAFLLLVPSLAAAQSPTQHLLYATPGTHITLPENTLLRVLTDQPLSTRHSKQATPVTFNVTEDVIYHHILAIPRGATLHGQVIRNKKVGVLSGTPELTLQLNSLDLGGVSYPIYTYQLRVRGATKTKPTASEYEGVAAIGAIAGAIVRGRSDTPSTPANDAEDIGGGAAIGATAVAAAAIVSPKPVVNIPAESEMDFYLASPISFQPPTQKEAERLSQRVQGAAPVLYIRGDTP